MHDVLKITLKLFLITAIAGLVLGVVYDITKAPIANEAEAAAVHARQEVFSGASEFNKMDDVSDKLDSVYECKEGGETVGYIAQITVKGYGGDIEIMVGMDMDGSITGVNVGGSNFSETPGLGARSKEEWFSDQFIGITHTEGDEITLGEDVDAITAATITSTAVTKGVNEASSYLIKLIEEDGGANK